MILCCAQRIWYIDPINSMQHCFTDHYDDVIMSAMASQINSLMIVYSSCYSGGDRRMHQSSASLAFVRGIRRWPGNSSHKGSVTRKIFPFDDVIMCKHSCENSSSIWHEPFYMDLSAADQSSKWVHCQPCVYTQAVYIVRVCVGVWVCVCGGVCVCVGGGGGGIRKLPGYEVVRFNCIVVSWIYINQASH